MAKAPKESSGGDAAGWAALAIATMVPFALREKGIFDSVDIRKLLSGAAGLAESPDFAPRLGSATRRRASALLQKMMDRVPE